MKELNHRVCCVFGNCLNRHTLTKEKSVIIKDETYLSYPSSGNVLTSPRPGSVRRSWKVDKQGNLIHTCEELVYCAQCLEANLVVKTVWGKRV